MNNTSHQSEPKSASGIERKSSIDAFGAIMLVAISANLGLNQALVKLVNSGMSPAFQAGMRSLCATLPLALFALWRGRKLTFLDGSLVPGLICGVFFAAEFYLLFEALERTTVGRASVLFYTMPIWVGVAAHFLIPGETLTPGRVLGLILAVGGVAAALMQHLGSGAAAIVSPQMLTGDLMALTGATGWAAIALIARLSKLSKSTPEMQLIYQLIVSAPILIGIAFLSGDMFREMTPLLWGAFTYQVLGVVAIGFTLWFWVLSVYPASDMASFAFLSPLFGVLFGWLIIGEQLTLNIILALALVGGGIYLVNRR